MNSSADITTRKSQFRMMVFLVLSFLAGVFIIWQWVKTVRELDSLSADGSGSFKVLLPKNEDDLASSTPPVPVKPSSTKNKNQ